MWGRRFGGGRVTEARPPWPIDTPHFLQHTTCSSSCVRKAHVLYAPRLILPEGHSSVSLGPMQSALSWHSLFSLQENSKAKLGVVYTCPGGREISSSRAAWTAQWDSVSKQSEDIWSLKLELDVCTAACRLDLVTDQWLLDRKSFGLPLWVPLFSS